MTGPGAPTLLTVILLAGCAVSDARLGDPSASDDETMHAETMRGTVVSSRTEAGGVTTLARPAAGPVVLVGPLEPELRRLAGARVAVDGLVERGASPAMMNVSRYTVLEIDGARPHVGTFVTRPDPGFVPEGVLTDTLALVGLPNDALPKGGSKVWIVGERRGGAIAVISFGTIGEP